MLAVSNLNQYYGGSHILRNLSFEAPAGKVVALLGRNGVGKSTLLQRTLMGLVPAKSGQVLFNRRTSPLSSLTSECVQASVMCRKEERYFRGLPSKKTCRWVWPRDRTAPHSGADLRDVPGSKHAGAGAAAIFPAASNNNSRSAARLRSDRAR